MKRKRYPGAVPSAIPVLEKLRGVLNTIIAEELEPQREKKIKKEGGEKNGQVVIPSGGNCTPHGKG